MDNDCDFLSKHRNNTIFILKVERSKLKFIIRSLFEGIIEPIRRSYTLLNELFIQMTHAIFHSRIWFSRPPFPLEIRTFRDEILILVNLYRLLSYIFSIIIIICLQVDAFLSNILLPSRNSWYKRFFYGFFDYVFNTFDLLLLLDISF